MIEVKSYLDSVGVDHRKVCVSYSEMQGRYKLFTNLKYRNLVFKRLTEQLKASGAIGGDTVPSLCLAVGKFKPESEGPMRHHFDKKGWKLITPSEIREGLKGLATVGYENDPTILAAKMLLKNS